MGASLGENPNQEGKMNDDAPASSSDAAGPAANAGAKRVAPDDIHKKADDTQKAAAIKKYGYKFPIVPDMVEDLAFNRAIVVFIIISLYVVLAFTAVTIPGGKSNVPSALQTTSTFPNAFLMRSNVRDVRAPRFRLLNGGLGAFPGATFRLDVARKFQYSSRGTIPCGDDALQHPMFADTLEHERVREACTPVLDGVQTSANSNGVASFDDFRVSRGPPGLYELSISGEAEASVVKGDFVHQVQVTSTVAAATVVTQLPMYVEVRKPFKAPPVVQVEDIDGRPVSNVTCVAFSSTEPNFFGKMEEELSPPNPSRTYVEPGYRSADSSVFTNPPLAHMMGQRLTTMTGAVSMPSDAQGNAVFTNLQLDSSTTETVYVCFYCEGIVTCWSDPDAAGTGVKPPISLRYKSPITLNHTVNTFEVVSPSASSGVQEVTEGVPFQTQPSVKIVDKAGQPVAGAKAIAVLAGSDGVVPPSMFLERGSKNLAGFISEPSGSDGVATFTKLMFKAAGPTRGSAGGFKISFCVDGLCLPAADAVQYTVKTSISSVLVMRPPRFIRFNGTSSLTDNEAAMPGEIVSQANVPPAVIRVLNGTAGIAGKKVTSVRAVRLSKAEFQPNVFKGYSTADISTVLNSKVQSALGDVFGVAAGTVDTSSAKVVDAVGLANAAGDTAGALKAAYATAQGASKFAVTGVDDAINAAISAASAAGAIANLPAVGEAFNTSDIDIYLQDEGGGAPDVSGVDGFVGVDVRFTYASATIHKLASLGLVGLVFSVDGVDSEPTPPVTFGEKTAKLSSGKKCAKLVAVKAPPKTVIVNRPFGWTAANELDPLENEYVPEYPAFKAVDAEGNPLENVMIAAVSEEEYQGRAPEFYKPDLDYTFTGADGVSQRKMTTWFSAAEQVIRGKYLKTDPNRDNYFIMFRGPRSDIIRDGPSGTMKLRYVAINTRGVDSNATARGVVRAAYEADVADFTNELQRIANAQQEPDQAGGADVFGLTAPKRFAFKSLTAYQHLCMQDDSVPGYKSEAGCEIECVSDVFEVEVKNNVFEISILPGNESDPLQGAYVETPDRFIRDTPVVSYNPTVVNCIFDPPAAPPPAGKKHHHRRRQLLQADIADVFDDLYRYHHVKFALTVAGISPTDVNDADKAKLKELIAANPTIQGAVSDISDQHVLLLDVSDAGDGSGNSIYIIAVYSTASDDDVAAATAMETAFNTVIGNELDALRDGLKSVRASITGVTDTGGIGEATLEYAASDGIPFVEGVDINGARDLVPTCGSFVSLMNVGITSLDGNGVYGKLLDIDLLHFPPTLNFELAKIKRSCPSRDNPYCYFNLNTGKMHWEKATNALVGDASILDGTTHQFTVFCADDDEPDCGPVAIFRQPVAGSKATGSQEVQTMFMPGNPGEYTFIFGQSGTYSKPVTVVVENRLTGIEIVSEPTAAQLEVKFAPGQVFPTPVLKLTGPDSANPQPIPSYSVSARFVDDSGNTAPVLLDVGRENFDNVMGTSRTAVSDANGNTQWFGAKAVDAVDGCYRMQFMYTACGGERDGPHPSACPTVEDLQPSGYFGGVDASPNILDPVLSVPTTAKWCFSNKGTQYAMKGVMSSTTTPGVNLPSTPVMRLSLPYKNSFIADEGLVVGFLMPYSIKRNSALTTSTNITAVKSASNALLSSAAAGDAAASSDAALDIADELFSETPDEIIPPIDRFYYARNTLSGNLCIWGGGRPVYGRCKKNLVISEVSPETSQADPATGEVVREYAVEAHFDQFQWNRGVNGELMQLIPARPVNFYFHQNDAAIAPMEDSEPSAKIQLRLEAATIAITLQPRQIVEVGGLFEVRVKVTIASGAPLPFVNVMANIAVGKGSLTETAAGFMDRIFGAQNASAFSSGLMPELDSTRVYARTNRAGVARFKLKTALGRPGYYALYFSTGKVRSAKSASFQLINPVNKVEVKTYAPNSVTVDSKTGFPAELPAPGGKVSIKVTDITGAGITPTQEAIIFHTQVVEVFPGFEKQDQSDNVKELMNGKSEGGTKELQAVYSIVVEGAKRLKPRAVATKKAHFIYDGEPTHVGDGVYEFANPRLVATAKGNFRVQFIVQGIAASVTSANATGHDQAVNVYSKAQADRIKWLNTIAVFALITFMFAGTFPHTRFPRLSLVLVMVFSIVGIAVVPFVSATHSPVWWITLYGSIACVILLSLISLLCTLVNHPATHSFAQRREASMFAYCRRLFSDPESAQAGSADENNKIGYHLKASLKDIASSAVSGISKDAFFYPTKVVAAFLVANAVVIVLVVNFIATAIKVSEATRELARKTVNTIFTYTTQLEEAYYSQQFAEISSIDEEWAYTQARSAGGIFSAFGDAYQISALIGVSVGLIIFVVSWVLFIATYRMTMLRMRRGIYEWDRERVDIRKASEYTGVHVSTSLITFALFSSIITVVCVPFSSPVLFRVMWSIVKEYWPLILSVVVPMIINTVVLLLIKKCMIEKTHIKRRWAWALWEVWDLMAQLLVGLAKGLARWIVAVVVAFFAIARTDKDALPAWVIGVAGPMLDPVASRVKAMMQMNHMHNAPVFRVAAWIIQRGADDFAQRDKSAPGAAGAAAAVDGFISAKASRVRNRFQVAFLIHKNPKLAEFRGAALQAAREEKEEALAESKWKMFTMCMPKKKKKNEDDADVEKMEVEDIECVESGKK